MPKKNQNYQVEITDMNNLGYGVCRIDNIVCFVKGGVTGDLLTTKVIKVNKNYCIGKIEEIITPSVHRTEPDCPVFLRCGGCCFRHISYDYELQIKKEHIESEFKKANLDVKVNNVVSTGETKRYRNKAQFPVDNNNKIGFYVGKTHSICEIEDCSLQPEIFADITKTVKAHLVKHGFTGYNETTKTGLLRHIYIRRAKATGETQVCLVINRFRFPYSLELAEELMKLDGVVGVSVNINRENTNVILGDIFSNILGNEYIEDILCGFRFRISPSSFYQVNHDCTELLYNKVYELVTSGKCDRITDLYCGTGTIGLSIAGRLKNCKLTGVEIVPDAIKNAKANAELNNIENAEFICADSSDTQDDILKESDVVILDPPRKGITKELAEKISECGVERIVYVSCSPDTLARDVKWFKDLGYGCSEATPFDMFPRTKHVESLVCLTRQTN